MHWFILLMGNSRDVQTVERQQECSYTLLCSRLVSLLDTSGTQSCWASTSCSRAPSSLAAGAIFFSQKLRVRASYVRFPWNRKAPDEMLTLSHAAPSERNISSSIPLEHADFICMFQHLKLSKQSLKSQITPASPSVTNHIFEKMLSDILMWGEDAMWHLSPRLLKARWEI